MAESSEARSPRVEEGSRAEPEEEEETGSTSQAKAKTKGPTWAEAQAMEKRLDSISDEIDDLTWRLNLEKFRCCFGHKALESIFPPEETRRVSFERRSQKDLERMSRCTDLTYDFERRLRKLGTDEELSSFFDEEEDEEDEEEEAQMPWPRYVKDMEEELSSLWCEYRRLYFEKRAPDFSGMTEADRAAEAERLRAEAFQEASRLLVEEEDIVGAQRRQAQACFLDFDPKQGGIYHNRATELVYLSETFDLFEESPIGPMRFTFQERKFKLNESINILSVKVAHSDVGFPIQVYGTVIVRDCTDYKRVYLFHRDREHCQLINSKDDPLILTGPKRGLLLLDQNYVETDLMIKDQEGQDRELSKGVMEISGIANRSLEKCEVECLSLATRVSTVEVAYAVVISAVEATISIEVEEGVFCGIVTAHTTSIKNRLVLYDSQLTDHMPGNGRGAIKMMRPVISVYMKDTLMIIARIHGGKGVIYKCKPRVSNVDEVDFTVGTAKMRLRVAWSMLGRYWT